MSDLPYDETGCTIHGSYAGSVVLEDVFGQGEIPLSILHRARTLAEKRDSGWYPVYGRQFQRDALIRADETAASLGLVELPSCHRCVDRAAINVDHHDKPVCLDHTPED